MTPRRWFHLLLGAIFIPLLALPLVWAAAIYWLRRAADADAHLWAKRILALAVIDTLVVFVAGVMVATGIGSIEAPATAAGEHVMIGVIPDLSFSGVGARVQRVVPGSPAAAAGLEAGDIITRVAGKEIAGPEALRSVVGELEACVPVPLEVRRGPSTSTVGIRPQWSSRIPRQTLGFFEPVERRRACFPVVSARSVLPWAIVLAAIAVVGVLVARRGTVSGSARGAWWSALSLVSAAVAGYAVPAGTCVLLGGPTLAGQVFALYGSSLALAGTALVGRRFVGRGPASTPEGTWGWAVAMGSWYIVTGTLRLGVLLSAVMLIPGARDISTTPLEALASGLGPMQGPAWLVLAAPVILLAPVGEELAFRGLLLPAACGWLRPAGAVALTAVIFAAMHWHYGAMLPLLAFVAAILGWARIASGGVRAPIVLHMLVNAAGFLAISLR